MKPYRICGSIICVHQQSHQGHWRGSTLQLEEIEVERTHILGETVTTRLRLISHPWEQGHWDTMFFPLQPGLIVREKSHLCGEMGWWERAGLPSQFCCSKTAECVSMWSPDKTTEDLRPGGFWLAKNILLWCHAAHNGMTMGMVIVLCLPRWNNMQLSIAKRGENYAVPEWKQSWHCSGIQVMCQ